LFALGLDDRLVGVTDWCIHPADGVARMARVRGTKNPDLDAIERPRTRPGARQPRRETAMVDVRRLRARGLTVWVDFPRTVADALAQIRWLAALARTRRRWRGSSIRSRPRSRAPRRRGRRRGAASSRSGRRPG
jgi:hypothetical protein